MMINDLMMSLDNIHIMSYIVLINLNNKPHCLGKREWSLDKNI